MAKEFKHKDYIKERRATQRKLAKVRPPFSCMQMEDSHGGVYFGENAEFTPDEMVRIAKWALEYYGENPENV